MSPLIYKLAKVLALVFILTASIAPGAIKADPSISNEQINDRQLQELQVNLDTYLPVVMNSGSPTIFGVETRVQDRTDILDKAKHADTYWVRSQVFSWNKIEPTHTTPANYRWEYVDGQALIDASLRGLHVIAIISKTPSWAQKYSGVSCGPIAEGKLNEFAEFLKAAVEIYSNSPYNVKYWELGNEPDIDRSLVPNDSQYGCWGEKDETYYGGEYYAEMLKVAYPAIKSVDPTANVLIGGLLLDCDPTHPPEGKNCKPSKFLEGILHNGGGSYFDIASFHGYPFYAIYKDPNKTYPQYLYYDENHPYWVARGGIVLGKIDFLREVMETHGVNKPIVASEAALTCTGCSLDNPTYEEAKANYVVWLYVRNLVAGVLGTTWYTIEGPGWRNAGMLDVNQNPRPAYNVYNFLTSELQETKYQGTIVDYPNLRGYKFGSIWKRVWILWAPDEQPYKINLPSNTIVVYDKYGVPMTPVAGQITVKNPVYIELPP